MKRFTSRKTVFGGMTHLLSGALLIGMGLIGLGFTGMGTTSSMVFGDGAVPTRLISGQEASAAGLARPWFNQVVMDPNHDKITQVTLQDDTLFITTDNGQLHVIDVVTGKTLWSRPIGARTFYSLPPAANSYVVVVMHGTTLHVFDRFDGKKLLEIPVNAPPGGGPQVSEHYIYVPILTGKIYAYPLRRYEEKEDTLEILLNKSDDEMTKAEKAKRIREEIDRMSIEEKIEKKGIYPINESEIQMCPALGEPLVQPFVCSQAYHEEYFSWVTTNGLLMIANLDFLKSENALQLLYKISLTPQTMYIDKLHFNQIDLDYANDINSRPTFSQKNITRQNEDRGDMADGGLILMGAGSGFVFAVNDKLGNVEWTYPVGLAVTDPIGVAGDQCFIPTFVGDFICLDIRTGKKVWEIKDIKQFISATDSRLYAQDMFDNLRVINRENGQTLHTIPLTTKIRAVFNIESDRIILIGNDGLIQCLHESQLDKPLHYRETSFEIAAEMRRRIEESAQKMGQGGKGAEGKNSPDATPRKIDLGEINEEDEIFGDDSGNKDSSKEDVKEEEEEPGTTFDDDNANAGEELLDDEEDSEDDESNPFE